MARAGRLTAERLEQVIGALEAGCEMARAAQIVGVSRRALYKAMDRSESFKQRVVDARARADENVIKSLYTAAVDDGNVTAMIFWLKNRRSFEWRDRHELGGHNGGPIKIEIVREDMDGDGGATDPHRDGGDP